MRRGSLPRSLRTRRGIGAVAVVIAALVAATAGLLVTRSPSTGTLALVGTTGTHADEVVSRVELRGPGVSSSVVPAPRPLSMAPQLTDLGTFAVPAGRYTDLTVRVGPRSLSSQFALTVRSGSLTPVLVAVSGERLASFVGNDQVNLGLLLTSGQVTTVPDVPFIDQGGREVRFSSLRGRLTVVGAFETHCHESCPLYTAVLSDLERTLRVRGWTSRVNIAEITMDPSRDTPEVLAAYAKMTGASWELLTAPSDALRNFWNALHVTYRETPYTGSPPVDWYTGVGDG